MPTPEQLRAARQSAQATIHRAAHEMAKAQRRGEVHRHAVRKWRTEAESLARFILMITGREDPTE